MTLDRRAERYQRSMRMLEGVRPELRDIAINAPTPYLLVITEGLRTAERQEALYAEGATHTMKSAHMEGRAFDFAVIDPDTDEVTWEFAFYEKCARAMQAWGRERGIQTKWGGDFKVWRKGKLVPFRDGPHLELIVHDWPPESEIKQA